MAEIAFHIWIPIVAIACGVVVAGILYFKNKKQYYSKWLTISLFVLRALCVACVVMLLINPFLTIKSKRVEQPVALLLCDNSASIALSSDSTYYKTAFHSDLEAMKKALSARYDVKEYLFGDSLRDGGQLEYSDNTTNLSEAMSQLKRSWYKRNVRAVLLFTDGIFNAGYDMEQVATQFPFPVHSLVMGDTMRVPDLMVKSVRASKSVAAGTTFPIQTVVAADNCKGKTLKISVFEKDKAIAEKQVEISSDKFAKEEVFLVTADEAKIHHYEIKVSGVDSEAALNNNSKSVFVDVKSQKHKALLITQAPHPDIAALQAVMNDDYDLQVFGKSDALSDFADADLLIICGVLAQSQHGFVMKQLEKYRKLPVFFIQGDEVSVSQLNDLQKIFVFAESSTRSMLELKANYNSGFSLFTMRETQKVSAFPPLTFPYLEIRAERQYETLLFQQVLGVKSSLPLLSFADDGRKTAFLFGRGLWRWRLFDFYQNQNHNFFDELFSKTLKYLVLEDDNMFTLHYNDAYYGGADVVMTAVVRNASNEVVTNADVRLNIENMDTGERYEHDFFVKNDGYEVNAGRLPEGAYQFSASTEVGNRVSKQNGTFIVANAGMEAQYLTADVNALMQMAALTDGSCRSVAEMEQLTEQLLNDSSVSSLEHTETRYRDLISMKWIIFVIIAAATLEWLLRKIFGTY